MSQNQEQTPPYIFELVRLNDELKSILDSTQIAHDVKYIRFNDVLRRYLMLKKGKNIGPGNSNVNLNKNRHLSTSSAFSLNSNNNNSSNNEGDERESQLEDESQLDTTFQSANLASTPKNPASESAKKLTFEDSPTQSEIKNKKNKSPGPETQRKGRKLNVSTPGHSNLDFKHRFQSVKNFIQRHSDKINWTENNELIDSTGKTVTNSDLNELILEYIRKKQSQIKPHGYDTFKNMLDMHRYSKSPMKGSGGMKRKCNIFKISYW